MVRSQAFVSSQRRLDCSLRWLGGLLVLTGCVFARPLSAQTDWMEDVGFDRLSQAAGSNLPGGIFPDGSGVPISLVEATSGGNYFPNINNSEFDDVTFLPSPLSNFSGHADDQAERFFGNTLSVAPGANTVTVYEAGNYLNNILQASNSDNTVKPDVQDFRVQNFSWVSNDTTLSTNTARELLRRFDFVIDRDNITALVGLNNNTASLPYLWSNSYNAIAVGRSDGIHSTGLTNFSYGPSSQNNGIGRSKPELVAPIGTTSGATAVISSVATFLHSANTVQGTDAANSEVIKAVLLAGASKNESEFSGWSQFDADNVWRPLDDTYGAGEVDLYNSYLITLGGQGVGGTSTVADSNPVGLNGWDYQTIEPNDAELRYDLVIPAGSTATELSVVLTWNAKIGSQVAEGETFSFASFQGNPIVANLNLEIVDANGVTVDLDLDPLGDVDYKEGLSNSEVDNVEHVYLKDLAAGRYTIKVSSEDIAGLSSADLASEFGLAWRTSTKFDTITADFDADGDVDGADFLTWQRNTSTLLNASRSDGDANGDGAVNSEDLDQLLLAFSGGTTALPSLTVPEPATWIAAIVGLLLLMSLQRRHVPYKL